MGIDLSVNLNKIALVRNSRMGNAPDPVEFAKLAIEAGADGITLHPRSDLRHVKPSDVFAIKAMLNKELNLEGNPFLPANRDYPGFMELVLQASPSQCTLVPDSAAQLTSDHGWDLEKDFNRLQPVVRDLKNAGIRVSLFIDLETESYEAAKKLGIDRVELYTEPWALAFGKPQADLCLAQYKRASAAWSRAGFGVNAGHDLNLFNLAPICSLEGLCEVSIGHALLIDAWRLGIAAAVSAYKAITLGSSVIV